MKILVYEKNKLLNEAIKGLLKDIDFVESVDYAMNITDFTSKMKTKAPDLLMIGNVLSEISSEEKKLIEQSRPRMKMLLMVNNTEKTNVLHDVLSGVDGYVLLNWNKTGFEKALAVFTREGLLFPHQMVLTLIDDIRKTVPEAGNMKKLSKMEAEILKLLCKGKQNKEIALEIGKTDRAVKNYLKTIYLKLGVSNRTEAVSTFYLHLKEIKE